MKATFCVAVGSVIWASASFVLYSFRGAWAAWKPALDRTVESIVVCISKPCVACRCGVLAPLCDFFHHSGYVMFCHSVITEVPWTHTALLQSGPLQVPRAQMNVGHVRLIRYSQLSDHHQCPRHTMHGTVKYRLFEQGLGCAPRAMELFCSSQVGRSLHLISPNLISYL